MGLKESLHIMVVDDMSTSRGLITQALDQLGIDNYAVENDGLAALQKLAARPVHLVLSDYNMPNMDGLELLNGLRQNRSTQGIGFILITGTPTQDIITRGQSLGMNNMLKKPFTVDALKTAIESVVGRL
jgi:two-component system chemotaxis response regulator CheY